MHFFVPSALDPCATIGSEMKLRILNKNSNAEKYQNQILLTLSSCRYPRGAPFFFWIHSEISYQSVRSWCLMFELEKGHPGSQNFKIDFFTPYTPIWIPLRGSGSETLVLT